MKGVVDIEFILAVAVFLTTITFVTVLIMSNVPLFHREATNEDLRSRAYEISQLLIFDQGYPAGWTRMNVERLGLSSGRKYILSASKIGELDTLCQSPGGYESVKALLGQDFRTDMIIEIISADDTWLASCLPPAVSAVRPKFQITRFASLEDKKLVKLTVGVAE